MLVYPKETEEDVRRREEEIQQILESSRKCDEIRKEETKKELIIYTCLIVLTILAFKVEIVGQIIAKVFLWCIVFTIAATTAILVLGFVLNVIGDIYYTITGKPNKQPSLSKEVWMDRP